GDEILDIIGKQYDTLIEVIGINGNGIESLQENGESYKKVNLKNEQIDIDEVMNQNNSQTKVIAIQRSKGYGQRPSIDLEEIEKAIKVIKVKYPNVIIFVDNGY